MKFTVRQNAWLGVVALFIAIALVVFFWIDASRTLKTAGTHPPAEPSSVIEIYKWTDLNGRARYSDAMPPPSQARNIRLLRIPHDSPPDDARKRSHRCELFLSQLTALRERIKYGHLANRSATLRTEENRLLRAVADACPNREAG